MFSGIIENKGFVFKFEKQKDFRLVLDTNLKYKDIKKGSSCLLYTSDAADE